MTQQIQNRLLVFSLLAMVVIAGCQDQGSRDQGGRDQGSRDQGGASSPSIASADAAAVQREGEANVKPQKNDKRKAIAGKAKDELFARLSARLMEVMQSDGPAAAINVCSNEAGAIAETVGRKYGVSIGRTSFKLRNPANAPRDWVQPFVKQRADTPQHVALDGGGLGALYPIRISVKCLMCHGGEEDILDAVKPELAKRYPRDSATGFKLDDLRGWFWVEVPATPEVSTAAPNPSKNTERLSGGQWQQLPASAAAAGDTEALVELGKKLFFDPRISLTGTVSCNSCHNLMEGGDDGRPTSAGIHGRVGPRNAPTVWNAAFQASQFWDGRSPTLEDQAKGPIVAAPEMGMPTHDEAISRVAAIPGYRAAFASVFGNDSALTIENTAKAIAAFERTLITPNSPLDRFISGDNSALTAEQIEGMRLFESVGCIECHSGPAFNGWELGSQVATFEEFPRSETELVGRYKLANDLGRFEVTKEDADKHFFKVPTLRNIAITAPYLHNGLVPTLAEAVRVMAEAQLDTELSDAEINQIVSFLTALEGEFPNIMLPRLPSRSGESVISDQASAKRENL